MAQSFDRTAHSETPAMRKMSRQPYQASLVAAFTEHIHASSAIEAAHH